MVTADIDANNADPPASAIGKAQKLKKKNKVRSAWISFFGRIVAQVIGATATVVLGIVVVRTFVAPVAVPSQSPPPAERLRESGGRYAQDSGARIRTDGPLTLAVLPVDNFSGDPRQEHFADAMTEALVARLASLGGVRVISRTSIMRFKAARPSLPEIARELRADLIVEASVATAGRRIRVTAQLIDAATDAHLWARTYDRTLRDVLSVQADVSSAIARDIQGKLATK